MIYKNKNKRYRIRVSLDNFEYIIQFRNCFSLIWKTIFLNNYYSSFEEAEDEIRLLIKK